jgi:hypothetical protein
VASRIVGIFGHKRAGKDTLADALVREFMYTKFHFADNLRDIMYVTNPIIDYHTSDDIYEEPKLLRLQDLVDDIGWEEAKIQYPEVRRIMKFLGTEGVRDHLGREVQAASWRSRQDASSVGSTERSGLPRI